MYTWDAHWCVGVWVWVGMGVWVGGCGWVLFSKMTNCVGVPFQLTNYCGL